MKILFYVMRSQFLFFECYSKFLNKDFNKREVARMVFEQYTL